MKYTFNRNQTEGASHHCWAGSKEIKLNETPIAHQVTVSFIERLPAPSLVSVVVCDVLHCFCVSTQTVMEVKVLDLGYPDYKVGRKSFFAQCGI